MCLYSGILYNFTIDRKWQQLHAIEKIAVRDENVTCIGVTLHEFASHLIEVDLQDNLLSSWKEVCIYSASTIMTISFLLLFYCCSCYNDH